MQLNLYKKKRNRGMASIEFHTTFLLLSMHPWSVFISETLTQYYIIINEERYDWGINRKIHCFKKILSISIFWAQNGKRIPRFMFNLFIFSIYSHVNMVFLIYLFTVEIIKMFKANKRNELFSIPVILQKNRWITWDFKKVLELHIYLFLSYLYTSFGLYDRHFYPIPWSTTYVIIYHFNSAYVGKIYIYFYQCTCNRINGHEILERFNRKTNMFKL